MLHTTALRVLTCGSVDDGKSTLIGRLLYEQNCVRDDHLASLSVDSEKYGTAESDLDFALLLDGLEAEREQGITIDICYRYFSTKCRKFIVADTPGHEQYTRNMATAASNADVAVLLVDARKGLLRQTRRHALISNLLGVPFLVLAVNKIDLVNFDQRVFEKIVKEFLEFASALNFKKIIAIPISARHGDNVSAQSSRTPWYSGPNLLEYLETADPADASMTKPFRMSVQWVNRPHQDFRGFAGSVVSGSVQAGDEVIVMPSSRVTRVKAILRADTKTEVAVAGDSVAVTLADEIDITRGDMLASVGERPQVADQFAAHLVWMSEDALIPGRMYLIKINHNTLPVKVTNLKHRLDPITLGKLAAKTLAINEIGFCDLALDRAIAFDAYAENRNTGSFVLIDRYSNETVAAGVINFALRRSTNIQYQHIAVSKQDRSSLMGHKPAVLWFTGLSGAGKSTIANLVEANMHARGIHSIMLDGDNIRHGLNKDLGFTESDRVENIRRIGEVARLMTDAGLVVLCSFISPFRAERRVIRDLLGAQEFIEIFVDAPIEKCIARDPKGLYRKALAGEIKNFTGVDQAYEPPENPDLHLFAGDFDANILAEQVIAELMRRKII